MGGKRNGAAMRSRKRVNDGLDTGNVAVVLGVKAVIGKHGTKSGY